ncbi:CDP-diacylglycerol--glycerol-3-phosphate 3-phosphatidyltransferase [Propionimicrobium lymphophilum]|uniref:CDP-diacylglycerol--glycerol-3-phosphate 3-phosphatidyltransferase n=1 Tax=Propionimicrobium lymphophilum TaxID=33012 RepID=UPI000423A62F|nr:CDP-diacylglycerol--glycerol-3-phosphate 3-phosphatidyltransferase [Propionimicrobium lymphophilum]
MGKISDQNESRPKLGFKWNVPNILTLLRIALVPVFLIVFLAHPHDQVWRFWSTVVFAVAILTDLFDGKIARKYNLITNFGKIWDSIADKALTGVGFIVLSIVDELPWWMTVIILLREWGITAMRFVILKYGVMAANRGGKLKTVIQSVALIMFLLGLPALGAWWCAPKWIAMWIAFLLTVYTGAEYIFEAARLRKAALKAGHPVDISTVEQEPFIKRIFKGNK